MIYEIPGEEFFFYVVHLCKKYILKIIDKNIYVKVNELYQDLLHNQFV